MTRSLYVLALLKSTFYPTWICIGFWWIIWQSLPSLPVVMIRINIAAAGTKVWTGHSWLNTLCGIKLRADPSLQSGWDGRTANHQQQKNTSETRADSRVSNTIFFLLFFKNVLIARKLSSFHLSAIFDAFVQALSVFSLHSIFLSFFSEESLPPASCFLIFLFLRSGMQDLISLHLLIPKSKLVSMRNWEECVLLTFFVECICTSCSSNPKQPTASLIKSSPWRLLSGAQVSSKKQHVHMNATNDHMLKGVDPQPVSCDPFLRKKWYKSFWRDYDTETM